VLNRSTLSVTIEARLQSRVFASTTLSIIFVNNQGPWLLPSLERLGNFRNGTELAVIMVVRFIDVAAFVINGLSMKLPSN
jgi:hypothetical protein